MRKGSELEIENWEFRQNARPNRDVVTPMFSRPRCCDVVLERSRVLPAHAPRNRSFLSPLGHEILLFA